MIGLSGRIIRSLFGIIGSSLLSNLIIKGLGGVGNFSGAVVTVQSLLLVIGLSVLIEIVVGIIPAYKSSKMNLVEVLRYG